MKKLEKLMQESELHIRRGEVREAKMKLNAIDISKVPREYRANLANLFKRSGSPESCLRLLNRIVHAKGSKQIRATPNEVKEYASALISIGVTSEAIELLSKINPSEEPSVSLYMAFAHFTNWDYDLSFPYLNNFLKNPKITEYQKYVGKVNLASALIATGQFENADKLLSTAIQEIEGHPDYTLLLGNMYELCVQILVKSGEYEMADQALEVAATYQKQNIGLTAIFLDKWRAINNAQRYQTKALGVKQLQKLAKVAHDSQHWETLRECQYFLSRVLSDDYTFLKVYFGTPYPKYRQRILNDYPNPPKIPEDFTLHLQNSILFQPKTLDIKSGRLETEKSGLKQGSLTHKLLCCLASDFFRPLRVPHLHNLLFPGDYFNPFSSPHRIHSLANRFRRVLKEKDIPLDIKSEKSGYRISFTEALSIKVYNENPVADRRMAKWQNVLSLYSKEGCFSRKQLAKDLDMHYRGISLLLNWAKAEGLVKAEKNGRYCTYKLNKKAS